MLNEIEAIQMGNHTIFEQVYKTHHQKLYFYILSKTSSNYIAEEIVQTVFIKLWNYRTNLSTEISIETQIFRIAKTSLIDLLRKNATLKKVADTYKDLISIEEENIMSELVKKETGKKISLIIEQMPPVRKKVFTLSREQGLSHKEIANQLKLTPKNVENHIAKALKQLKKAILLFLFLFLFFF